MSRWNPAPARPHWPCAEALVPRRSTGGIAAVLDPNPLVAGKGMAILQAARIETSHGVLVEQARWINRGFFSRMERKRPLGALESSQQRRWH